MVIAAKNANIKRFIYASTSSVYGVSEKEVKEDHPLIPLTLYNKYKGMCEPMLLNTDRNFEGVIFRPATVCGYAQDKDLIYQLIFDQSCYQQKNHSIWGRSTSSEFTYFGLL